MSPKPWTSLVRQRAQHPRSRRPVPRLGKRTGSHPDRSAPARARRWTDHERGRTARPDQPAARRPQSAGRSEADRPAGPHVRPTTLPNRPAPPRQRDRHRRPDQPAARPSPLDLPPRSSRSSMIIWRRSTNIGTRPGILNRGPRGRTRRPTRHHRPPRQDRRRRLRQLPQQRRSAASRHAFRVRTPSSTRYELQSPAAGCVTVRGPSCDKRAGAYGSWL